MESPLWDLSAHYVLWPPRHLWFVTPTIPDEKYELWQFLASFYYLPLTLQCSHCSQTPWTYISLLKTKGQDSYLFKTTRQITLLWFCTGKGKTTHSEIDGSKNFPNNRPLNLSIFNLILSFPNIRTLPHFPRTRQVLVIYDVRYTNGGDTWIYTK